jgi:serine/threonine protein kinase/Flp pilus assembly protein TadD
MNHNSRQDAKPIPDREQRLDEVVTAYLKAVEAGAPTDREQLLGRYPELAQELRQFFADQDALEPMAAPLRLVALAAEAANADRDAPPDPSDAAQVEVAIPRGLGDFRILRELGRGGMGVVFEAEQLSLKRRVALKVLPLAATLDPRRLQRFQNEARAAASLHHTNIVPVFAVGDHQGIHYYAMQLIAGQTLAALLQELRGQAQEQGTSQAPPPGAETTGDSPPPGAGACESTGPQAALSTVGGVASREYLHGVARLGAQAAEALDYAHQLGVVHRDIKPSNLTVDGRGQVWVTDFGLAQFQQGEPGLTLTGDLVGTLRYMSPEQALGKRAVVDHRTDVYSLGATLYQLLTLQPVFPGTDRQELLRQIAFEEPVPLRKLNKAVPAELETIVLKAIEKNPAERYGTAQELADDLRRYLEDRPIQARRPSIVQRVRKWTRRHRPLVVAASICLLVTLAAIAGSVGWVLGDREARQREAEGKVREALSAAEPGLKEGNPWDTALISAVQRANAQLGDIQRDEALQWRIEQLNMDVKMLTELEAIRLDQGHVRDGKFDLAASAPRYQRAFLDYGIDVKLLEPQETVVRVQDSAICTHLVAAFDDWAALLMDTSKEETRQEARQLVAIARQIEPNTSRQQLRDMVLNKDNTAIEQLLRSMRPEELPKATLVLVGRQVARRVQASGKPTGAMLEFLRRGQRRFPDEFWINNQLAFALTKVQPPRLEEAIGFYRAAVALRPLSPGAHVNLGIALNNKGDTEGAIAEHRAAIRLKHDYAGAHNNLGLALKARGDTDGAIAEYRQAKALKNDFADPHLNLGIVLLEQKDLDGAIEEFKTAIRLKSDVAEFHCDLARALCEKGSLEEAAQACQSALKISPEYSPAHNGLGCVLSKKGDWDGAIAEFQAALRFDPKDFQAHRNLANGLSMTGDREGAIREWRAGLQINSEDPQSHANLGVALGARGELDEAIAELRRAVALKPDYAVARQNLSKGLVAKARLAREKELYAAAARWYSEAFATQPALAKDLRPGPRRNAACCAALAACGQGQDAAVLNDKERARLRKQALDWLKGDLQAWSRLLDSKAEKAGPAVAQKMAQWLDDPGFAGLRGPEALARLPAAERADWQKLWQEVEALRQRATRQGG